MFLLSGQLLPQHDFLQICYEEDGGIADTSWSAFTVRPWLKPLWCAQPQSLLELPFTLANRQDSVSSAQPIQEVI